MNLAGNQNPSANPSGRPPESREVRWQDLPRLIQTVLERTPRGLWYRIRPIMALCPETHRILDLARVVDQVIPRSTLGIRQRSLSKEQRTRKAQELIESLEEFWGGVERLEAVLEKIARSCGFWGYIDPRRKKPGPGRKPEHELRPSKPEPVFHAEEIAESGDTEDEASV